MVTFDKRLTGRCITVLLALGAFSAGAHASEGCQVPAAIKSLLEESVGSKKSITLYVDGHRIPILVIAVKADDCVVEGRNQQFGRILIRLDRVDAAAGS